MANESRSLENLLNAGDVGRQSIVKKSVRAGRRVKVTTSGAALVKAMTWLRVPLKP